MKRNLKKPSFGVRTEWVPVSDLPATPQGISEIAIDLETKDPRLKTHGPGWATGEGDVAGISIAYEGTNCYLPFGHEGGGNLDRNIVLKWFQKEIADHPADKIFHNAAYDVGWLKFLGIKLTGTLFDPMLAAPLIDENRRFYSLNAVAYDYLGEVKNESLLREAAEQFGLDPKAEMYKLPAGFIGEYAEKDSKLTLDLWHHLKAILIREDLWQIFELETSVLPLCIEMTWRGVRVDLERAEVLKQDLLKNVNQLRSSLKKETGIDVELWAAASVAKVFDKLKIEYGRSPTNQPSFTKNFLTHHPHPVAQKIAEARELDKLGNTFLTSIFRYASKGRIHAHINQLRSESGGTVTGRISMSNPNLQQIPARNPKFSQMIRGLFLPEENHKWASMDFSQQEPRILVHFASLTNGGLKGSKEFVQAYTDNPKTDFHQMVAEIASSPAEKITRFQAKTINLSIMYGAGQNKIAEQLDIDVETVKEILQQYHERVPFVRRLQDAVKRHLEDDRSRGELRSLLGRKCRFPLWEPNMFVVSRALPREEALTEYGANIRRAYVWRSLNRLIQSSAADMTKQCMVKIYQELDELPLVQIHDELAFSVPNLARAQEICSVMQTAVPLAVPTPSEIALGDNWGQLDKIL